VPDGSRRFRKRAVVVEAEQYTGVHPVAGMQPVHDTDGSVRYVVDTLEGPLRVASGDWIITGVACERYPCKPEIFAVLYEPADI
jgi:hypothetical protein